MPYLPLVAMKFCWISCAVSALLYIETCGMLPEKKLIFVCKDLILNCVGVVKGLVPCRSVGGGSWDGRCKSVD
jgi:hypothetical protein